MSQKSRLERVERSLDADPAGVREMSDADWLAYFASRGRAGAFAHEPDFERALAAFAAELPGRAGQFGPSEWLMELHFRREEGIPPCGEQEYQELVTWATANRAALSAVARQTGGVLDLGDSIRATIFNLLPNPGDGPRKMFSGALADRVRRARKLYGDAVARVPPPGPPAPRPAVPEPRGTQAAAPPIVCDVPPERPDETASWPVPSGKRRRNWWQ